MGSFKDTTETLMNWLEGNGVINEVTFGDANEVDLSKATNFPLVHLIPLNSTLLESYSTYTYQILFLTTFKSSNADKIKVLDDMATVVEQFIRDINQGSMFEALYRTDTNNSAEVIYDQRQNRLYGWTLGLSINVPTIVNCAN